ncbi:MAG: hypothetical protein IJC48_10315 [Clostridia bacterium]|nr:hypothetical protein [Clostridia bacterium]MBQ4157437.1 hypothetical protein [Clostridia bacterium]
MITPGKADYHIHYYIDGCAKKEMTFENIERASREMGLTEIAVLKHYSECMPNGKSDWAAWHTVKEEEFERYLKEFREYTQKEGLIIHSGVETELVDDKGRINIGKEAQDKIELIALSVHYMPEMEKIKPPFLYHPAMDKKKLEEDENAKKELKRWKELIEDLGCEYFIAGIVNGYISAIRNNPKIRQLSHMYDGLYPLRTYYVPYERIPEKRLIEMMEPLMKAMTEHDVLWELTCDNAGCEGILKRADEMGVRFVATSDAHMFEGAWGRFSDHIAAERYIESLELTKGVVNW